MALQGGHGLTGFGVPEPHGPILAGGGELPPVGAIGHRPHPAGVALQGGGQTGPGRGERGGASCHDSNAVALRVQAAVPMEGASPDVSLCAGSGGVHLVPHSVVQMGPFEDGGTELDVLEVRPVQSCVGEVGRVEVDRVIPCPGNDNVP